MRSWTEDDPKAELMARKRVAIIDAATRAFLLEGYSGSSVNRIADSAGVSIKTLYRHFDDKDDLFVAVIQAACAVSARTADPGWLDKPPLTGLTEAGGEHLRHVLSDDQLALYRVVTHDAQRFPELGRRYQQEVVGGRVALLTRYLGRWPAALRDRIADPYHAIRRYSALLHGDLLETALHGGPRPGPAEIDRHAGEAAADLLALVEAGRLS